MHSYKVKNDMIITGTGSEVKCLFWIFYFVINTVENGWDWKWLNVELHVVDRSTTPL